MNHVAGQQILINKAKTSKKKAPKNAFSFFLEDAVKELRKTGQNVSFKGEAVSYASEKWKSMSPEEKSVYEEKAKAWKIRNKKQDRPGRLDCTGQPIDFRVDMEDLTEKQRRQARKVFRSQWPVGKGVCDVHFYLISFQSLFELPDEEGYQPCEVACIDYTLNRGIERVWHKFIDPGPIKLGMRAEIKIFAEKNHRIPEEGFDRANGQYHMIWDELIRFVNPNRSSTLPPLFCKIAEKRKTVFCLEWLSAHAGVGNRLGKVYELEDMAAELFDHSGMMRPSLSTIENGCNSHMYDFETNTMCDYHEEIECIHCALLAVNKCCYWMSDSLAKAYGFEITDQHLPVKKELSFTIIAPDTKEVEDYPGHRRQNRDRPNPLASRRNENHEFIHYPEDMHRQAPSRGFGSRDVRYRPSFDVVPVTTQCTVMPGENSSYPVQSFNPMSTETTSLTGSGDQNPKMQFLSGNKPSTGLSRRPVSNPHFANKHSGTLAANFQVKPKEWPPSGDSSMVPGDGIDALSQDFDGSVNVSSSVFFSNDGLQLAGVVVGIEILTSQGISEAEEDIKPRIPKAMLGRGRGRFR